MHTSVYCEDIFRQIHPMFHTLKWDTKVQDNQIGYFRHHYELEVFEIRVTRNRIFIVVPLLTADVGYSKMFCIEDIYSALNFLKSHIDNYVDTITLINDCYSEPCPTSYPNLALLAGC